MVSFGEVLRRERECRDIALDEIALATRIPRRLLVALEENEFSRLPGDIFARGYVQAYARYLGTDAEPLLKSYDRAQRIAGADRAPSKEAEGAGRAPSRRRRLRSAIGLGIAATVAIGAVIAWSLGRSEPDGHTAEAARMFAPQGKLAMADKTAGTARPDTVEPRTTALAEPEADRKPAAPVSSAPAPDETRPAPDEAPPAQPSAPRAETAPKPERQGEVRLSVGDARLTSSAGGAVFAEGMRVSFHTRVTGGRPGDRIEHVWMRRARIVQRISLDIGGSNWRTRSVKTMSPGTAGEWTVEARTPSGRVLARRSFACRASPRRNATTAAAPTR